MVKLGSKVRDTLTGFAGIAVSRTEWLYGCTRVGIEPTELRDGKPMEAQYFDEQRVEVIREDSPRVSADSSAGPGGDRPNPARSADPRR